MADLSASSSLLKCSRLFFRAPRREKSSCGDCPQNLQGNNSVSAFRFNHWRGINDASSKDNRREPLDGRPIIFRCYCVSPAATISNLITFGRSTKWLSANKELCILRSGPTSPERAFGSFYEPLHASYAQQCKSRASKKHAKQ